MTRFGEISTFWQKKLNQTVSMCQKFNLVCGSILNLFGLKIAIGQSFIILNGQILKNDLPIWSHSCLARYLSILGLFLKLIPTQAKCDQVARLFSTFCHLHQCQFAQ